MDGLAGPKASLDLGNSGTAMRLFCGLLAGQRFDSELIGDASLMRRPMERVAVPLRRMGAVIDTNSGCPPVRIAGGRHLQAIRYELPMASAQVKSAILLAGLYADGTTSIKEPATTRDHSERMVVAFILGWLAGIASAWNFVRKLTNERAELRRNLRIAEAEIRNLRPLPQDRG